MGTINPALNILASQPKMLNWCGYMGRGRKQKIQKMKNRTRQAAKKERAKNKAVAVRKSRAA